MTSLTKEKHHHGDRVRLRLATMSAETGIVFVSRSTTNLTHIIIIVIIIDFFLHRLHYYHQKSVSQICKWMKPHEKCETYHYKWSVVGIRVVQVFTLFRCVFFSVVDMSKQKYPSLIDEKRKTQKKLIIMMLKELITGFVSDNKLPQDCPFYTSFVLFSSPQTLLSVVTREKQKTKIDTIYSQSKLELN